MSRTGNPNPSPSTRFQRGEGDELAGKSVAFKPYAKDLDFLEAMEPKERARFLRTAVSVAIAMEQPSRLEKVWKGSGDPALPYPETLVAQFRQLWESVQTTFVEN